MAGIPASETSAQGGLPGLDTRADHVPALAFVVFKIADHRLFDAEMVEQLQRDPRVLRGDEIGLPQGFRRARGKIGKIADRRADHH